MTNLEKMRQALKDGPKPTVPPPPKPPKEPKPTPKGTKPPPPPPKEKVVFRCKCAFTPQEISKTDCNKCLRLTKARKKRERRERLAAAGKLKPRPKQSVVRLPDGSQKHLTYAAGVWAGTLMVPDVPEVFQFEAATERDCFHGLHGLYEAWLQAQHDAAPEG